MLEPGNLDRILKGTTGSGATHVEVYNGVPCLKSPLPVVWNNLYTAWNLAFCANYSDWPLMFAKLLNPATLGLYQACSGNFMVVEQLIFAYICLRISCTTTRKVSHFLYLPLRDPGAAARTLRVAAHSRSVRARLLHGLSGRRFSHSWGHLLVETFTSSPVN